MSPMRSNVALRSNIMLDVPDRRPERNYIPGDYFALLYPNAIDKRVIEDHMSRRQRFEYGQTLTCVLCKRPCAGTCKAVKLKAARRW